MTRKVAAAWMLLSLVIVSAVFAAKIEQAAPPNTVQVHMVATVEPLQNDEANVPLLNREDVQVRQGKDRLPVTAWIPSRGDTGGLQLLILIDDTSDTSLGLQFNDLRTFIEAQPKTTWIGLGYMRNTGVTMLQNFTNDHAQVSKALRLPMGTGASDSPYLSLISVLKGWPENKLRREVLMITSGIDRLRGNVLGAPGTPRGSRRFLYISPDVDRASREAQKSGVIVHSIYAPGVGHAGRNFHDVTNGQNSISKLADETGGESYFLGVQSLVSFKPYLDRLQRILDNQYYLVFLARPGKKADLQRVNISTEVPKLEIVTGDNVWVPLVATQAAKQN